MRGWGVHVRNMRGAAAALLALAAPVALTACTVTSYAGIPLQSGAAGRELQQLARRAQAGDKHAQLELGIRYEEGRGVPVDLRRAEKLYRLAASDSGRTLHIYTPAFRKNGAARVLPIRRGLAVQGLPEARARLEELGCTGAMMTDGTCMVSRAPKWNLAPIRGPSSNRMPAARGLAEAQEKHGGRKNPPRKSSSGEDDQ